MRAKSKLFSVALSALLLLGFAATLSAQISHQVQSTPVDVVQTGLTEVMGEVRLIKSTIPANTPQTTIGGTVNVLYVDVPISNTFSGQRAVTLGGPGGTCSITDVGGITIDFSAQYCDDPGISFQLFATVTNTAAGGLLTISFPTGLVVTADGQSIAINGVRARVTGKPVGADVNASLQALPSNAHSFINVSQVRVARTNDGLTIQATGIVAAICLPPPSPTVRVLEGFPGAFVHNATVAAATPTTPANPRPRFGANTNTHVNLVVTGLPSGVTLTWPASVNASTGTGTLRLVSVSVDTAIALYRFDTTDQALSDLTAELFLVSPTVTVAITAAVGVATVQGQLYPSDLLPVVGLVPRFDHPLEPDPGIPFVTVQKCRTYLLFPFLTNAAGSTFNSGMAVANTTNTTGVPGLVTPAQSGSVTLYGFPQFPSGGTQTPVSAVLASNLESGNTVAASLDGITGFAGFQGYAIAVCEFQFGHGFAFISGTYGSSVPVVAEGFLALVIPDPAFTGTRLASPPLTANSGENLGN
ncbi:MAG: hypothetical protein AB1898_05265 [Acidobacteriota bacterium]